MAVKVFPHMEKIGHRGAKRELPENTLPAFQRAFERGAQAVELDVHCTSDRVVVVHHDPTWGQVPNSVPIAETPWEDLRKVELAPGIGIPSLADVLAQAPAGATVYVEIKGAGIEPEVAEVIRQATVDCAVHSFDHDAIARMSRIAPEIARGILFEHDAANVVAEMHRTGSRDVWPNWRLIDSALVDAVHKENGRVIAWTVNDARVAATLRTMGVDGVCGDDVRLFDGL